MKVQIIMTEREKKIALVLLIVLVVILYIINKKYLFILDVEFTDDRPTNLLLKTGFIFPEKTIVQLNPDAKEKKVKWYGYIIRTEALKNESGKLSGEYRMDIFKNAKAKEPYKSLVIHTDDYYVKYYKTPLGKI